MWWKQEPTCDNTVQKFHFDKEKGKCVSHDGCQDSKMENEFSSWKECYKVCGGKMPLDYDLKTQQ